VYIYPTSKPIPNITMGTRYLICIYHNGRFVVAQYGHANGEPDSIGVEVLEFLTEENVALLRQKIHLVVPIEPEEPDYDNRGKRILDDIVDAEDGKIEHVFKLGFASDGLFCEFAYVVDLDASTLEVYRGQCKGPLAEEVADGGRFAEVGVKQQTLGVAWSFDELPKDEEQFVEACWGPEER
jgi:hypothetical protein